MHHVRHLILMLSDDLPPSLPANTVMAGVFITALNDVG